VNSEEVSADPFTMRCLVVLSLPILALSAVLGYYLSMNVPPEIEQPWIYRSVMGLDAVIGDISSVYAYAYTLDPLRVAMETQAHFAEHVYPGKSDSDQVSMETIAGVRVRVWQPATSGSDRPAVIYIHGGGFVGGSIYQYEGLTRRIAEEAGAVVFNIDYSLALDTPSPGPLNDCYDVTTNIMRHAHNWNINPKKVIVAGDSAGGTLAAALALRMRDEEYTPALAAQILIYPLLQGLDLNLPSYVQNAPYTKDFVTATSVSMAVLSYINQSRDYIEDMMKNEHVSVDVWEEFGDIVSHLYLPKDLISKDYRPLRPETTRKSNALERSLTEPYNFPLVEEDVADMPQTLVITKEHDCLRDEGYIYTRRLRNAGNDVTHIHDNRGWHGDISYLDYPLEIKVALEIAEKITDFIKEV